MDNFIKKIKHCPQCENIVEESSNWIGESSLACPYCGYSCIKTAKGEEEFKGYGALTLNGQTTRFMSPISFQQEQEILEKIIGVEDASFFKWNDDSGLTVIKGELGPMLTDEEEKAIQEAIDRDTYYSSFAGSYPVLPDEQYDF